MSTDTDSCRPPGFYPGSNEYVVEWFCVTDDDTGISYRTNTNEECDGECEDGACVDGFFCDCTTFDATSCLCQISVLTEHWLVGCNDASDDYCSDCACGCADTNGDGCNNLQDFSEIMARCSGDLIIDPIC